MFVKNWMNTDFPLISVRSTVQEALSQMRKYKTDYCVTVDEEGKFTGFVYKNNIANAELESKVEDYVVFPDFFTHEDSYIEEAALTFRESQERCLAVVDFDMKVTGVITLTEVLEAFVAITAMDEPGVRVLLELEDRPGELKKVFDVFALNSINVLAVNTVKRDGSRSVSVKLDAHEPKQIERLLKEHGIQFLKIAKEEGF
ncbi:signal transduction protein [Pseudothermotoga hypogea DSM 11164 = NBRC 106472]|uniref:Signal transduction protein n=3 Tax=Thermotogaceae TaxID=188709 RepID=A0A0X1KRF3_9THEM|nr:signal transduction protein [Pseudothermotoga hypogea DSM 11164 = NBRC 106472]